jgi:hypothetical protein
MVIWYISWPFGIYYGHLVFFPRFGILYKKIWQHRVPLQMQMKKNGALWSLTFWDTGLGPFGLPNRADGISTRTLGLPGGAGGKVVAYE